LGIPAAQALVVGVHTTIGRGRKTSARRLRTGSAIDAPPRAEPLFVPVAVGELIDKITILQIKTGRIADPLRLTNVTSELQLLLDVRDRRVGRSPALDRLAAELKEVNQRLWDIEDRIRDCERRRDFGPRFVELARAVYRNNDERARLKREINDLSGSAIVEEKSYRDY
jgi:hypothetical protein